MGTAYARCRSRSLSGLMHQTRLLQLCTEKCFESSSSMSRAATSYAVRLIAASSIGGSEDREQQA